MSGGRPRKMRLPGSGEKILAALRTAGLTWSTSNVFAPNHVLNNKRWKRCGLPMSPTTIANDIRLGSPMDRIDQYASFFGVDSNLLVDSSVAPYSPQFTCEVLKNKSKITVVNPMPLHTEDPLFCRLLSTYNSDEGINEFYGLFSGLFDIFLLEQTTNTLFRTAVHIHDLEKNHLILKGYTRMHGVNVFIKGRMFRWGTFIHINYFSEDVQILGYMMTHDPLVALVSTYKQPLRLPLVGMSGSLASPFVPDRFYGYAQKALPAPGETISAAYAARCDLISREPGIQVSDPDYPDIMRRIVTVKENPENFHFS